MSGKFDTGLRYKHVEAALAAIAEVRPEAIGAFRGRLRHLRNIGLPSLSASGSGKHIVYSRRQALEILVAVQLENIGHKPQSAAMISLSIVRQAPYGQHESKDCYVIPSTPGEKQAKYKMMFGLAHVLGFMKSSPAVITIVNVSALARKLDSILDSS